MAKLRSVSTAFWSDPFIEDLTPNQKLLFLYLITNEKTNMLGIYEASIKKISFETGINKLEIEKAFKAFESLGKVKYVNNYIILVNYMKHQKFNTNMKKSAIDVYNDLPNELKQGDISISKDNPSEGFERLLKAFGMVRKIEDEVEDEVENEVEKENDIEILQNFSFEDFWDVYDKKVGDKSKLEKKWNKFSDSTREEIMRHVEQYKNSQPEKQYRKNPQTYFNNESWKDEIITVNNIKPQQNGQPDYYEEMARRMVIKELSGNQ